MKRRILLIINSITLILAFAVYAFSSSVFTSSIEKTGSLFAPASYAFSIWWIIFPMLTLFCVFQWIVLYKKNGLEVIDRTGVLFLMSNLLVAGWMVLLKAAFTEFALITMVALLIVLILLVIRLRLEIWDAPVRTIFFVWWPFAFYFGWVIMETLVRIAAYFFSLEGNLMGDHQQTWTLILILFLTGIYLLLIFTRNLRETALTGIWGLAALAFRHESSGMRISLIAGMCAFILLVAVLYHGYRNRETSPFNKLRRGEF